MRPMARRGSSWVVITATLIATWEGMSLVAYPDNLAGGIPTVCAGITRSEVPNLKVGDRYTQEACDKILAKALPVYNNGINQCIHVPLSDDTRGSVVSLAYNIGIRATCRSTFVRHLNARDPDACDYMLWFDKASGRFIQGLKNRREDEYRYCVRGLNEPPPPPVVVTPVEIPVPVPVIVGTEPPTTVPATVPEIKPVPVPVPVPAPPQAEPIPAPTWWERLWEWFRSH